MSTAQQLLLPTYGSFLPTDLPGIVLDADVARNATNDGTNLTAWTDSSGNGHVANAIENTVPYTLSDANFGGRPTIGFTSGNSERVRFDSAAGAIDGDDTAFTLYMVSRHTANSSRYLWSAWDSGAPSGTVGMLTQAATSPTAIRFNRISGAGATVSADSTVSAAVSTTYCYVLRFSGTVVRGWMSNTLIWDNVASDADTLGTCDRLGIGAGESSYGNVRLARFVLYTGAHTLAQVNQMRAYLGPLYGLALTPLAA